MPGACCQGSMLTPSRDGVVVSGRPDMGAGGCLDGILRSDGAEGIRIVKVDVDGEEEEVELDEERGPRVRHQDGSFDYGLLNYSQVHHNGRNTGRQEKTWTYLTSTEKTIMLHMVAKRNRRLKEHTGVYQPSASAIEEPPEKELLRRGHYTGRQGVLALMGRC
eukprot:TRINITY_DN50357_c0_g1_i1.p2 TRINITY_DN50357_c0_g1~~TRINITY_DN50357_c0_g1_i1.p2  ORF type:complete len:163 (-),score=33.99 TRINITY_DN50357_c0_g1_i1:79-567(-)